MKKLIFLLLISSVCNASIWECINTNFGMCNTWRMKVPHGWIVEGDHDDHTLAMIFYPDETHEWRL